LCNGISIPQQSDVEKAAKMILHWRGPHPFSFYQKVTAKIAQKAINKNDIIMNGLTKSYEKVPCEK
jgi:hypothetical protein